MRCFNDYLSTSIGGCAQLAGAMAQAYLIPRDQLMDIAITDGVNVSFDLSSPSVIIPVFIDMDMPYKLAAEVTRNDYGLQKVNKTVELFIVENSPLTQKQVSQLQNDPFVLVINDNNDQRLIVGLERGLTFVSSSQEISSTETHGGIVVTMSETNVNHPMLFGGEIDIVPVTGITVDKTSVTLTGVADTEAVTATILPAGVDAATIQDVIAVSGNTAIATVSVALNVVTVTSVAVGVTSVAIRTKDGNYKAEVSITVNA